MWRSAPEARFCGGNWWLSSLIPDLSCLVPYREETSTTSCTIDVDGEADSCDTGPWFSQPFGLSRGCSGLADKRWSRANTVRWG
jgi:hypothetical protein